MFKWGKSNSKPASNNPQNINLSDNKLTSQKTPDTGSDNNLPVMKIDTNYDKVVDK